MAPHSADLSVLFVDITDSTKLLRTLGDAGGREVILEALDCMAAVIEGKGGRVVDRIGDELMCTLPGAGSALEAAITLHETVEGRTFGAGARVLVRVGFHHGPVLLDGDRIFGDTVHTARRMASAAKAAQVVTTGSTLAALGDGPPIATRIVGRLRLAGHKAPVEAHEIVWNPDASTTVASDALPKEEPLGTLELRHGGETWLLGAARAEVALGRDPACDVTVEGSLVSRRHSRIEVRDHRFVLVDMSTNGSTLCPLQGDPIYVKRGEWEVTGAGLLRFGPLEGRQDARPVAYRLIDPTSTG